MQKYLLIALGGALGSAARYWTGATIASRMGSRFPFGTLIVNITACAILGFSLTLLAKRTDLSPAWRICFRLASWAHTALFPRLSGRRFPRFGPAHFYWLRFMRPAASFWDFLLCGAAS